MVEPTPVDSPITLYCGQTFTLKFQMTQGTAPNITPIDLTGATAEFTIVDKQAATKVVLLTSKGDSPTTSISLLEDGWVEAKISDEVSSAIAWKKGFYNIKITWSNGETWRVFQGEVTISFGV